MDFLRIHYDYMKKLSIPAWFFAKGKYCTNTIKVKWSNDL
jgi:hypothetical protein